MNKKKKLLITTFAVVAIVGVVVFLFFASTTKIDLNDYLTISYTGVDGMGKADYDINYKQLITDYAEELGLKNDALIRIFSADLKKNLSGELSNHKNLSNGDEVSFSWSVNHYALENNYDCIIEYTDVTEKVAGLKEAVVYNPFENIKITFEGVAPYGKVKISSIGNIDYGFIQYVAEPVSGVKNGDIINVSIVYDEAVERLCLENGLKIVELEKEYTVEGMSEYVTELSQIPEEKLQTMKTQGENALKSHVASEWVEEESLEAINYLGSYLLNSKEKKIGYGQAVNYLYLIYKIDVTNSNGSFSYYYYTRFENLYYTADGDFVVDISNYKTPEGGSMLGIAYGECFKTGDYWYLGYKTIDEIYNACITSNLDSYKYESNVTE